MVGWGISFREKHMQEFLYRMLYNKKEPPRKIPWTTPLSYVRIISGDFSRVKV